MATRRRGFWRGLLAGVLLAAAAGLALAWLFPPEPTLPPAVDPGTTVSPDAPAAPAGPVEPVPPADEQGLLTVPPGPLIEGAPAPEPAPGTPDQAAGAPSLVPGASR